MQGHIFFLLLTAWRISICLSTGQARIDIYRRKSVTMEKELTVRRSWPWKKKFNDRFAASPEFKFGGTSPTPPKLFDEQVLLTPNYIKPFFIQTFILNCLPCLGIRVHAKWLCSHHYAH